MNEWYMMQAKSEMLKRMYPKGTRIELISMDDPYNPIKAGTKGTVEFVDDMGTIHMKWDNGRTLGLVAGEDSFKIIQE
jgi:hypothetical protein